LHTLINGGSMHWDRKHKFPQINSEMSQWTKRKCQVDICIYAWLYSIELTVGKVKPGRWEYPCKEDQKRIILKTQKRKCFKNEGLIQGIKYSLQGEPGGGSSFILARATWMSDGREENWKDWEISQK
jgi:hypothetical protein